MKFLETEVQTDEKQIVISKGLKEFEAYLKRKERSHNTILSILGAYKHYFSLYDRLSVQNLQEYKEYLIAHYKTTTVNSKINGINHCLSWLDQTEAEDGLEELWDSDMAGYRMKAVKLQMKPFLENVISQEDYTRLKVMLRKDNQMLWYFVVRFLGGTGARVSELIQIKAEHLKLGYVDLYSKGGKMRRIYFSDELCREAEEWVNTRGIESGFLFTGRSGGQLTTRGIGSQLKVFARRYGIPEETVYPHSFRHRFAMNFLAKFNDISLLADLMGHESIQTTRIYLTQTSREQRELIDRIVTW